MKLICLGDSFTAGFGVKKKESWFNQLSNNDIIFINKGINGDTTSGMLARFQSDVIIEAPKYVLITGGINDFISGSSVEIPQNNYMAIIHQSFHHNIIPIVGIEPDFDPNSIRDTWAAFSDFDVVYEKHKSFSTWLKKMCHTFGVFYIDFYEQFNQHKIDNSNINFYIDGLHLTPGGHKKIAEIIDTELMKIIHNTTKNRWK